MPAHTPLPPLTFTGSKCLKSVDDCIIKMSMISSDVVLSKVMAETRFRGEAALVNVKILWWLLCLFHSALALMYYYLLL